MKRSHSIVALFALVLTASGCGRSPDGNTISVGAEPAKRAEAKAPVAAAAPVKAAAPARAARPAPTPAPAQAEVQVEPCDHIGGGEGGCDVKEAAPEADKAEPEADKAETVALGSSPSRGAANAPVTVVVFSDFQCPFCAKAEGTIHDLEVTYPGKIRFVFKNQPLPFHVNARLAAKAALAANEQGKFWEYHDALFAHQKDLDRASLERYAEDLDLNLRRFRADLDDPRLDIAVEADITEAHRLDVKGTPTFFVNGRIVVGAQPIAAFRAKVDQALAER